MASEKSPTGWYYFFVVVLAYLLLFFLNPEKFFLVWNFFIGIIVKIIPVFILVFILMFLSDYFIHPKKLVKHLRGNKIKTWALVIVGGVLSSGPIYMWYPLLADLKRKGLKPSFIAAFLYNRAIKLPLLPLMIFYFGVKYVALLSFLMIIFSILDGVLVEKILEVFEK